MKSLIKVTDQPVESFRYERKYQVEQLDGHQIRLFIRLHPALFVMPYPPRWVNNIYLDTPQLDNYSDNISGAVNRCKIRLRWYHGLFDQSDEMALEFKIKQGIIGRKIQYSIHSFKLDESFNSRFLKEHFIASDLPSEVKMILKEQMPVLVNRYKRWYFATADGRFRITVDTDLTFYHVGLLNNYFRSCHKENILRVVELKYQKKDDLKASRIASNLPFTVYKNSKYVHGMDCVYW